MKNLIIVLGFLSMSICSARAQVPAASTQDSSASPKVVYKKNTEINLDELALEADTRSPDNFEIVRKTQAEMGSLLRRRTHFHDRLLRDGNLMK